MTEALGLDESPNPPDTSGASEDMYIAHARKGVADEGTELARGAGGNLRIQIT